MSLQTIDIGVAGNDGTGDSIRESFRKTNDNFLELYAVLGLGKQISFSSLSDAPVSYLGNQIIAATADAKSLAAKTVIGGTGIQIANTNSTLTITSTAAGVAGDTRPTLTAPLNAAGFPIGAIPDPSQPLVELFNALYGDTTSITIDQMAISKGYADNNYLKVTSLNQVSGPLRVRAQPLVPQVGVQDYDSTLTSNYLSTEAMQRKDVVYRGGDEMSGILTLSDHPAPLSGYGSPTGQSDLQAATKFYVDNSTFASGINLYVSTTTGDDLQQRTPAGKEGRFWQYAYKSVGASVLAADTLINLSQQEPGPYQQLISYTLGPDKYFSSTYPSSSGYRVNGIQVTGGNSGDIGYQSAFQLLQANRTFIQKETIAYINSKYVNPFTYDVAKWQLDISNILDAVGYDLVLGTTYNTTRAASAYFDGAAINITNELVQTIEAIKYIKNTILGYEYNSIALETYVGKVIEAICYDLIFQSNYQSTQVALYFPYANTDLSNTQIIAIITDLQNTLFGIAATPTISNATVTSTVSGQINQNTVTVLNNTGLVIGMNASGTGIASGAVITNINSSIITLSINNSGPVSGPGTFGTNAINVSSASNIAVGQNVAGIGISTGTTVLSVVNNVVILSYTVTSSSISGTGQFSVSAILNSPTIPAAAATSVSVNFSNIISIITTGNLPTIAFPPLALTNSGAISAKILLLNNLSFLQAETIAYLGSNYPTLSYSRTKYKNDIKYIVWSLIYDFTYGGNSQSAYTGLNYWNGNVENIAADEVAPIIDVLGYINTLMQNIVTNTSAATVYQTTVIQYVNLSYLNGSNAVTSFSANIGLIKNLINSNLYSYATVLPTVSAADSNLQTVRTSIRANENNYKTNANTYAINNFPIITDSGVLTTITNLFAIITNLLSLGISSRSTPAFTNPSGLNSGYSDARTLLLNSTNLNFITAETNAWIVANNLSLPSDYDSSKSARDLTYIIEAICYDFTYGGNAATTYLSGKLYANLAVDLVSIFTSAITFAQSLATLIATNTSPSIHYSAAAQYKDATDYPNGSVAVSSINSLFNALISTLNTGILPTTVYPVLSNYSNTVQAARLVILNNSTTITSNTTAYISANYSGGFSYNETICYRDIGFIIDGVSIDILTAGTYQCINSGRAFYRNASASAIAIGVDRVQTIDGIGFVQTLIGQVLTQTSATRYQTVQSQYTNNTLTSASQAIIDANNGMTTLLNIITQGLGAAPTPSFGTGLWLVSFNNGGNGYVDQGAPGDVKIIPAKVLAGSTSGAYGSIVTYTPGSTTNTINDTIAVRLTKPGFFQTISTTASGTNGTNTITVASITSTNFTAQIGMGITASSGIPTGTVITNINGLVITLSKPITATLTSSAVYIGEQLRFGETVSNLNITIHIESGIYYEDFPLKLPANVTIKGDDFRRTIIRPLDRVSQSPWRNIFFYRDAVVDALEIGVVDYNGTNSATNTTATLLATTGLITITLLSGQVSSSWIGQIFADNNISNGNAKRGRAIITSVSGNEMTATVIYPFLAGSILTSGNWFIFSSLNYGRHYLTNPLDPTSTPKNNQDIDVLLCNEADRIVDITFQGHRSFSMVLDPTGNVKTKSPYVQSCSTFTQSINAKQFAGGQYIDAFTGRLFGTITAISNNGYTVTVQGGVNSGLDIRPPSAPFSFYVGGFRYQVDDVVSWNYDTGTQLGTVVLTLDVGTPYLYDTYGNLVYNQTKAMRDIGYVIGAVTTDMVLGTNYRSIHAGLGYLRPYSSNLTGSLAALTISSISYAGTIANNLITNTAAQTAITTNINIINSMINQGTTGIPTIIWTLPVGVTISNNLAKAQAIIQNNRTFIQAEIVAWIQTNYVTKLYSGYNSSISQRDIGYIVDAITYDLLYGGNSQTVDSAEAYWRGTTSYILGLEAIYVAAYGRLQTVLDQVIAGSTVTVSGGNNQAQVTSNAPSSPTTYSAITDQLCAILIDYVLDGTYTASYSGTLSPISIITTIASNGTFTTSSAHNMNVNDAVLVNSVGSSCSISNTTLTVSGTITGAFTVGQLLSGTGVAANTYITAVMLGAGGAGTYTVSISQSVATTSITGTGVLYFVNATPLTTTFTLSLIQGGTTLTNFAAGTGLSLQVETIKFPVLTAQDSGKKTALATIETSRFTVESSVITYLNNGAGQAVNLEQGGNKSMLGNDHAMLNDLAYGVIANNGAFSEQVCTFTYYCHTGHWSNNGGQIRCVGCSNTFGDYGLRSSGYDQTELPDSINLSNDTMQTASIYRKGLFASSATATTLTVYIIGYEYTPTNGSELEIDHGVFGGSITRYEISSITHTLVTVYGQNVLQLNLSTTGDNNTTSTGLATNLYDGQIVTIRVLTNIKFYNIDNVRPTRPSTALQYYANLSSVYRIVAYNLTESTGEILSNNIAILQSDTSFLYYQLVTDVVNLTQPSPNITPVTATYVSGSLGATSIVFNNVTNGPIAAGMSVLGTGITSGQYVVSVSGSGNITVVLSSATTNTPSGTYQFSTLTQGSRVGDTTIAVTPIADGLTINQLNTGIYITAWYGRTYQITSYVPPILNASGIFFSWTSGTSTLVVSNVSGTITTGMAITGYGITGTVTVGTITTGATYTNIVVNTSGGGSISSPSGTITFGTAKNSYITINPIPVYNNAADGTAVSALTFISAVPQTGSTSGYLITFDIPYSKLSVLPVIDSVLTVANNGNTGYNGSYQVTNVNSSTLVSVSSASSLSIGMSVTTTTVGAYIPTGAIITSIGVNQFTISPAAWITSGATLNAAASNTIVQTITISNVGSGYTVAPTLVITNGGYSIQATATCTIVNGVINTVTITNPGFGYTSTPSVVVSGGGGGINAAFTVVLSTIPTAVTTTSAGTLTNQLQLLYLSAPGVYGTVYSISASGNAIVLSSSVGLSATNPIIFTFSGTFGNLTSGTTYYVLTNNTATGSITVSTSSGGGAFTPAASTLAGGTVYTFFAPQYTYGTGITSSVAAAPSGTGPYTVAFTIASSSITNGAYYHVTGSSNTLYNGFWQCTSATSGSATSIILSYPLNPGTFSGPVTITKEVTSGTSNQYGIAKAFNLTNVFTMKAGYPSGVGGQIIVKISTCRATGHDFCNIGTGGYNTSNIPTSIYGNPALAFQPSQQILEESVGRCFYVSTDENGIFKVGRFFQVDQGTGTVTFSASIALSNLSGLGFKRGVVVSEFSTDSTMVNNGTDIVPVESAIRSFVDYRLGLNYSGGQSAILIGPGFLPLDGSLSMKKSFNMNFNNIYNVATPVNTNDATNKTYVDTLVATYNGLSKLIDVTFTSLTDANQIVYNGTSSKWVNTALPSGNVNITYSDLTNTLTTTIQSNVVVNSMVSSSAAIAQSKLSLNSATTRANATNITQANLGLASFDSTYFSASSGWISLVNGSLSIGNLSAIGNGSIVANFSGGSASPQEVTAQAVVQNGLTQVFGASAGIVTYGGSLNSTSLTSVTTTGSPNSLVKTDSNGYINVGQISLNSYKILATSGTTLQVYTPSGYNFLTSVGSTLGNTTTSFTGTLDVTGGTLKSTSLTTGASATNGTIIGNWQVLTSSAIDFSNGTLKSTTLTTGTGTTVGSVVGNWQVGSGSTWDISSATLKSTTLTTGGTTTPGTITGAWSVNGSLSIGGTGNSITTTGITSGSPTTAGTLIGAWGLTGSMTGIWTSTGTLDVTAGTLKSLTLTTGSSTTPGTLTGAWNVTGSLTGGNVNVGTSLTVTSITSGSSSTAGSLTGNWSLTTGSTLDCTLGTFKTTTITTGADATPGTIQGTWSLIGASKLQATYADLAEFYEGDIEYTPGTVLVFGGDKEVTTTDIMNDTRVAGVVTTDPAYVMNADQKGIKVCIALAGRVPCKVVGRIKKGDMLTTGATPGFAVKASNPTLGSIIGKALEDKDYGEAGVIQIAVGRA